MDHKVVWTIIWPLHYGYNFELGSNTYFIVCIFVIKYLRLNQITFVVWSLVSSKETVHYFFQFNPLGSVFVLCRQPGSAWVHFLLALAWRKQPPWCYLNFGAHAQPIIIPLCKYCSLFHRVIHNLSLPPLMIYAHKRFLSWYYLNVTHLSPRQ